MALIKSKTLTNGITGNYWRITSITVDKKSAEISVFVAIELFTSEAHRETSPIPDTKLTTRFVCTLEQATGNLLALCYQKIIEKNFRDLVDAVSDEDLGNKP